MSHDFDRVVERRGSGCLKWDDTEKYFGHRDVLPLWVADMDFPAPREVIEALRERVDHGIFGYEAACPGLYGAQVEWLKKRFGWEVQENWITLSPGVIPALTAIIRTFTHPGDGVLVQPPVYPPFFEAIKNHGCTVEENPLKVEGGRYRMDFDDLEEKLTSRVKLLILCSPHNPVGRVWEEEEIERLDVLCRKKKVLVVSDEIHSDLVLTGRHIPFPLISPGAAGNSVVLTSTSKTFNLAGIQTSSTIISDPELRRRFRHTQQIGGFSRPNIFGRVAAEAALRCGEAWLEALLEYVRGNLAFFLEFLEEHLPELKAIPPEGTYLVWLDCRGFKMTDPELKEFLLKEAGVGFNLGSPFGPQGQGFVRVNIACPRETLQDALERVRRAWQGRGERQGGHGREGK